MSLKRFGISSILVGATLSFCLGTAESRIHLGFYISGLVGVSCLAFTGRALSGLCALLPVIVCLASFTLGGYVGSAGGVFLVVLFASVVTSVSITSAIVQAGRADAGGDGARETGDCPEA